MATVFNFPSLVDRDWQAWADAIREASRGSVYDDAAVASALVKIKEHWSLIFKPTTLEMTPRHVPGDLTDEQAVAIQDLVSSSAQVIVEHLKEVRAVALGRIITLELTLAHMRTHGNQPQAD